MLPVVLALAPLVPVVLLALHAAWRQPVVTAGLDAGVPIEVAEAARAAVATETDPQKRSAFAAVLQNAKYLRTSRYVAQAFGPASGHTAFVGATQVGQLPPGAVDYSSFQADPSIPSNLKAQLTQKISSAGTQQIQDAGMSGIQAVAGGGGLSPAQVSGGFALASAGALALGAGMSLTAAVPVMAPIAAVVFGGGAGIDALMKSLFHISDANTTQIYACTPSDASNGTGPGDPKWKHAYSPSLYDGYSAGQNWAPATSGKFETWARPILMRADDGYLNCQPPPGVQQIDPATLQKAVDAGDLSGVGKLTDYYEALWQLGLLKAWNDSNAGAPTRQVSLDTTIPYGDPRGNDPVQKMLWRFRRTLTQYAPQLASGAPISVTVADPSPAPKLINLIPAVRASAATSSTAYLSWNLSQWVAHYVPGIAVTVSD